MNKFGKIMVVLAIVVISGAAFGFYMYNMPVAKTEGRSADFEVNSTSLFSEFETDEKAANEKYLDKVVRVTGTISEIQKEKDGHVGIILDGGGMLFGISCRFEEEQVATVESLQSGDEITVKGVCTGMLSDVILIRSVLENQGEKTSI